MCDIIIIILPSKYTVNDNSQIDVQQLKEQ